MQITKTLDGRRAMPRVPSPLYFSISELYQERRGFIQTLSWDKAGKTAKETDYLHMGQYPSSWDKEV